MSKYGNRKITEGGITFDSKKEWTRWHELLLMQKAGIITDLRRQVRFELIPKQYNQAGKLIERAVTYVADFCYQEDGHVVVEDTKGMRTREYILKRKLFLQKYGVQITEV